MGGTFRFRRNGLPFRPRRATTEFNAGKRSGQSRVVRLTLFESNSPLLLDSKLRDAAGSTPSGSEGVESFSRWRNVHKYTADCIDRF